MDSAEGEEGGRFVSSVKEGRSSFRGSGNVHNIVKKKNDVTRKKGVSMISSEKTH